MSHVSIVIVHYRAIDETLACVRSLRSLQYPDFDVIVVSNDEDASSVGRLRSELKDATLLVATHNGGYCGGNNLGIAHALAHQAEFVLLLNPDTLVVNPDFVSSLVDQMRRRSDLALVGPKVQLRDLGRQQNTIIRFPWVWRRIAAWLGKHAPRATRMRREPSMPKTGQETHFQEAEAINGVCVLLRSKALCEVGLLDENVFAYIEDIDWAYRAAQKNWKCGYLAVESILHLQKTQGYHLGSVVDFLLKRNTLYFLMKSRRLIQAAMYSLSIVALGFTRAMAATIARRAASGQWNWFGRVLWAFTNLWNRRTKLAMGKP